MNKELAEIGRKMGSQPFTPRGLSVAVGRGTMQFLAPVMRTIDEFLELEDEEHGREES